MIRLKECVFVDVKADRGDMIAVYRYIRPEHKFRGSKLLKDNAAQEQVGTNAA